MTTSTADSYYSTITADPYWLDALSHMQWLWTKKVDGLHACVWMRGGHVSYEGKLMRQLLPMPLLLDLYNNYPPEWMRSCFGLKQHSVVHLMLREGLPPMCIDIAVGGVYMDRRELLDTCEMLEIGGSLELGDGPVDEAYNFVYAHGHTLILRPMTELATQRGERIIMKVER